MIHAAALCLALGDSLAVGTGQALHCDIAAHVGASSRAIVQFAPAKQYDFVVISAGTNDPPGDYIEVVRARVRSGKIVWILPVNGARAHVLRVAAAHGDRAVSYTPGRGRVWPHPYSYAPLAAAVRGAWS